MDGTGKEITKGMDGPEAAPPGLLEMTLDVDPSSPVPLAAATSEHNETSAAIHEAAAEFYDGVLPNPSADAINPTPLQPTLDPQSIQPNPFPTRNGGVTTKGCVWDVLRHYPDGLVLAQLVSQIISRGLREFSGKNATGTVSVVRVAYLSPTSHS